MSDQLQAPLAKVYGEGEIIRKDGKVEKFTFTADAHLPEMKEHDDGGDASNGDS